MSLNALLNQESKQQYFEKIGGRQSLIAINKVFYDKIYQHPWLKNYFEKIPQAHIEIQQVDFMQKVLGGQNIYVGKAPPIAHTHINITDELFAERKKLLCEAFEETNAHPQMREKWLSLDESFHRVLVKKSLADCVPRFKTDPILDFPNSRK
ncbi:MAG: group 1 truncated hemoglobin [Alteromonadaceae bacterium]|nr:group 1 truncated hemoglobin [Alteromonadaceae bacterium]